MGTSTHILAIGEAWVVWILWSGLGYKQMLGIQHDVLLLLGQSTT